jgi:glycerate-2-kinase
MTTHRTVSIADMRRDARKIFYAAVHAAEPAPLVHAALLNAPELRHHHSVRVISIGKAAVGMALAALETIGERVTTCTIVAPHETIGSIPQTPYDPRVEFLASAHPLPDEDSVRAAHTVIHRISSAANDEVIVALVSGGASSLIALPIAPITVDDYRTTVSMLLNAGADITALNTVRQSIDAVKGGALAGIAAPRTTLCLVMSDVIGNPLHLIGSGPFASPPHDMPRAIDVVTRLDLCAALPATVMHHISGPPATRARPQRDTRIQVIADNTHAIDAAAAYARRLGYDVAKVVEPVTGLASDAGAQFGRQLRAPATSSASSCIIAGGETVVRVEGAGRGGRNQEIALAAALEMDGTSGCVFLSAGTDGIDGVTDAAGGIVDGATAERIRNAGRDARVLLRDNDSHTALEIADDLLVTGPTGTNVLDLHILLRAGIADDTGTVAG